MAIQEGSKRGIPALIILEIMPFMLPEILGITLPASMLFSICSVFGRMTGSNEIVALKSLGISPMAVIWPVLVLASFLSLGTVWMYEVAATWCKPTVLQICCNSIEPIVCSMLQKNRSCSGDQFPMAITVKKVNRATTPGELDRLIQPTITINGPPKTTISAAEATLHTDWSTQKLMITCWKGEFDFGGQGRVSFPDKQEFSVPIPKPSFDRFHRDWASLRNVSSLVIELENANVYLQKDIRQLESQPNVPEEKIEAKRREIKDNEFKIRRLRAEPYRRWANGFTCLCFALLGAPVAMLWRHTDVLTNFFVCFLPILAIYYPLLVLSDNLSTSGKLPPFAFWTANIVLAVPAAWLLRWLLKH
jgi:lipopolysaccharide export system permease protein